LTGQLEVIVTAKPNDESSSLSRLIAGNANAVRLIAKRLSPSDFASKVSSVLRDLPQLHVYVDLPGGKPKLHENIDLTRRIGEHIKVAQTAEESIDTTEIHVCIDGLASFQKYITRGTRILIGDGAVELTVSSVDAANIYVRVTKCDFPVEGGRSVNIIPHGGELSYQSLTDSDLEYLAALSGRGLLPHVDILVSFASPHTPWERLTDVDAGLTIIPKIESAAGVNALRQFLDRFSTVMIGRADLSLEVGRQKCDEAVRDALAMDTISAGRQIIVASLLLDSLAKGVSQPSADEKHDLQALFRQGARRFLISGAAAAEAPVQAAKMLREIGYLSIGQ
jgi:pyruvate kinase